MKEGVSAKLRKRAHATDVSLPLSDGDDAARIEKSHGPGLLGVVQPAEGPDGAALLLLTVHGATGDEPDTHRFQRVDAPLLPRLDLTDPAAERAR